MRFIRQRLENADVEFLGNDPRRAPCCGAEPPRMKRRILTLCAAVADKENPLG